MVEGLTDGGKVLHEHLKGLRPMGHRLARRATLDSVLHGCAALYWLGGAEARGLLVAARVPSEVLLEHEGRLLGMLAALVDLGADELLVARGTLKLLQPCEHLPEDILPANVLLAHKHHKLVDVPVLVGYMLGDDGAVHIDKELGAAAVHPLALIRGVQGATVDASVQHVVL